MLKKEKRYLYLSNDETRLVVQSLIRFKNKLQQQGRFTDCVDELILKWRLFLFPETTATIRNEVKS